MKFLKEKKKLVVISILLIIGIAIPLTLILLQQQQDIRQHAASSTTLTFTPTSTTTTPIHQTLNTSFPLDLMLNPGTNAISVVRYEISYDPTKVAVDTTAPFSPNTSSFPATLEGPIYASGKISGTISIGSDYSKAISSITKIATVRFKTLATTGSTPTQISYTTNAQVLSVSAQDQASENVLSSTTPAYLSITAIACTGGVGGNAIGATGITVHGGNGGSSKTATNGDCIPGTNGENVDASNYCSTKSIALSWQATPTATYYRLLIDGVQVYNGSNLTFAATNYSTGVTHNITLYSGNLTYGDFNPSIGGSFLIGTTACASPTPTPLPAPSLTFTASPISVAFNGSSTLTWTSSNVTSCTASGAWTGTKTTSGSQSTGQLTSSPTYTLACTGPGGNISKTVSITVGVAPTNTPIPTPTPTRVPTATPTPLPTNTPIPTATPIPLATKFTFTLLLHGLGHIGDTVNPAAFSLSNQNPIRQQRNLIIEVLSTGTTRSLILTKTFTTGVKYDASSGNFSGTVDMGTTLTSGVYNINVHSDQYLYNSFAGVQVNAGQTNTFTPLSMITGDVNNDDSLNILDYDIITGCYADFAAPIDCPATIVRNTPFTLSQASDLTDDGKVDQYDYNLFLREYSVQKSNRIIP